MNGRWVTPVDPDCPAVANFHDTVMDDPMTRESGCGSEIMEDFETRHRLKCVRCQEYGAANVDVEYGP
jgi:hypothetical protein